MTTPTSGAISLNQIHIEAGGSSGAQVSLNDLDVRYLANFSSGATMGFNNFYNRTRYTVTSGSGTSGSTQYTGFKSSSPAIGSINTTSLTWSTASVTGMYYVLSGSQAYEVQLLLGGSGSGTNSGFTTYRVAGGTYARTSASFSGSSGFFSVWRWSSGSNPFTNTTVRDCYFY